MLTKRLRNGQLLMSQNITGYECISKCTPSGALPFLHKGELVEVTCQVVSKVEIQIDLCRQNALEVPTIYTLRGTLGRNLVTFICV